MSNDAEQTRIGQYIDRAVSLLEQAERLRIGAQHEAQVAADSGRLEELRIDASALLGPPETMGRLKLQFDELARPFIQVAYAYDIDASKLEDFIRNGDPGDVSGAIHVLRRLQGIALQREVLGESTGSNDQMKQALKDALVEHDQVAGSSGQKSKPGNEKWRRAQIRMIERMKNGKLPSTLRDAAKYLKSEGFGYNTVRDAAHRSPTLRAHFDLKGQPTLKSGSLLDELAKQSDSRTRQVIENMTPDQRVETEKELQKLAPDQALELVKTLGVNPDAGSTGDLYLIENTDQDSRTDDCSE